MNHELMSMTSADIKAMNDEEKTLMLSELLSQGAVTAGIKLEDLQEMEAHLIEWYGEERSSHAALALGVAIALGCITASAYRIMIGDRELVESTLSDMAKMGEPLSRAFLRANNLP